MQSFGTPQPSRPQAGIHAAQDSDDDDESGPMRPLNRKVPAQGSASNAARASAATAPHALQAAPAVATPAPKPQPAFRQLPAPKPASINPLTHNDLSHLDSLLLPPPADGHSTDDDSPVLKPNNGQKATSGEPAYHLCPDCSAANNTTRLFILPMA